MLSGERSIDLCFVDAGDLPQLCAVVHVRFHLEQQQLPLQRFFAVQHEHLPGDFQTLGLQYQLLQSLFVAGKVTVMRLTAGSLVAETVRLSMLKPRRQNRLDTRARTPLWLSTSRLMTLR